MPGVREQIFSDNTEGIVEHSLDSFYQAALDKHRNGDSDGAEKDYRFILSRNPNHAGSWHFLGMLHHHRSQFREALTCLEKALSFDNTRPIFHNNYDVVLMDLERTAEAETAFRRALEFDPQYADARSNLARIRLNQGNIGEAQMLLESLLKQNPDHLDALTHYGELLHRIGGNSQSLSCLEKVLNARKPVPILLEK